MLLPRSEIRRVRGVWEFGRFGGVEMGRWWGYTEIQRRNGSAQSYSNTVYYIIKKGWHFLVIAYSY